MSGQLICLLTLGKLWAQGASPTHLIVCPGYGPDHDAALTERMIEGVEERAQDALARLERGPRFASPAPLLAISAAGLRMTQAARGPQPGHALFLLGQPGAGLLDAGGQRAAAALIHAGASALGAPARDGLLGQALSLARAADLDVTLWTDALAWTPDADKLVARGVRPRGAERVWEQLGHKTRCGDERWRLALCDPLPAGLLIAAPADAAPALTAAAGRAVSCVGELRPRAGGGARLTVLTAR